MYFAPLRKDGYKVYHPFAYRPGTTHVYSNMTPRFDKHSNVKDSKFVLFAGLQAWLMDTKEAWDVFFSLPKEYAVKEYSRVVSAMLGKKVPTDHFEALHDLGYLPIRVKALPEGTLVPYGVPFYTIVNTVEGFGWVTNMLETDASSETWMTITSATTAFAYRARFEQEQSLRDTGMIKFLGHDFSYRGMPGRHAAAMSGFGHLCSFVGSDNIPAALFAEKYYGAQVDKELVFASVDATEHSVMCSYGNEGEKESLLHLMTNVTPTGILSVVSDTWDFWKLVTKYLPELKDVIMGRDGTVVIRPDSGDPVKILTGYTWDGVNYECFEEVFERYDYASNIIPEVVMVAGKFHEIFTELDGRVNCKHHPIEECEVKGLIQCLWDTFGGTIENGLKRLDSHIGAIYGDSITLERQDKIIKRLLDKGFVPSVVLGIGSFTYQYVTRDTHGTAVKATDIQLGEGNHYPISKDPKTDASKKSARGLLMVVEDTETGTLKLVSDVTPEQEASEGNLLKTIYENGNFVMVTTLNEIREKVDSYFKG
ncbi:nicotinamide phosphoribosyltransferase [Vibrio phage JSF12]|uniref:Nicotinamide phosphoribosyltransferase n=2 Tax=Jesfedecavirus TaxID=2560156 RepID=A0A2D0YM15_9CAUD|nr:nicotinamide phosphoribosyl transferase [Vibrio phage JSF10]YP_009794757.1 nicotinamide phosphoribosyl transferase [Vibrio phage JSF12]ASV43506.1 nicotinamide phosphoribosyltransferase [Vibrio phage JSF10]ASV43592.1 nicotinamide phosphoribosyltransferase [Vibrio phage JSF12]